MTTMGCCGRRPTAMGLLEMADAYPPSHPRGAWARKKLAFSVVADKAKRTGNRAVYDRAMAGLQDLGTDPPTGGTMTWSAADRAQVTSALRDRAASVSSGVSVTTVMTGLSDWATLLTTLARTGVSIARAACGGGGGCDQNALNVAQMIISWISAALTGGAPEIPQTLTPDQLNGFVAFCSYKDALKNGLDIPMQLAIGGLRVAALRGDATARDASTVLNTVWNNAKSMMDGICNISQIAAAVAAANAPSPTAPPPVPTAPPPVPTAPATQTGRCWDGSTYTQTWDPVAQRWGAPSPGPCPAAPPAVGLETGAGGCVTGVRGGGPGQYNMIAPGGIADRNGRPVPGTAGARSCATCHAPSRYVPGVVDPATQLWRTPPACIAPSGHVINSPTSGPCPQGTSRGADGVCRAGGGGGGLVLVGAAAIAAKILGFF